MKIHLPDSQKNALVAWVNSVLGITTILAYSGEDRPAKPYAVIDVIAPSRREEAPARRYKELDTFTYQEKRVFTLNVVIIADDQDNTDYAGDLISSQELETYKASLRAVGLNCRYELNTTVIPAEISTEYEYRVSVDFLFATHKDYDDEVGEVSDFEMTINT